MSRVYALQPRRARREQRISLVPRARALPSIVHWNAIMSSTGYTAAARFVIITGIIAITTGSLARKQTPVPTELSKTKRTCTARVGKNASGLRRAREPAAVCRTIR